MEAKRPVAIKNVFDVRLLCDVVCHTSDGHNLLSAVLYYESLSFEHRCIDFHQIAAFEPQQSGVLGANGLSVFECDSQLRVEGCKEVCHQVLKAVEDTQGDHHRPRGNGYAKHRYAADDVDGMMALLGKEVAAGYEQFKPPPSPPKEG